MDSMDRYVWRLVSSHWISVDRGACGSQSGLVACEPRNRRLSDFLFAGRRPTGRIRGAENTSRWAFWSASKHLNSVPNSHDDNKIQAKRSRSSCLHYVRDQFVAWVASSKIRKRLFQEPVTKTLADVLKLAITIERSMADVTSVRSELNTAHEVNRIVEYSGRNKACNNCGQLGHNLKTERCPATAKKCTSCGKLHHFAKCCRSSSNLKQREKLKSTYKTSTNQVWYAVSSDDDEDQSADVTSVHVASVEGHASVGEYKFVTCRLNGVSTELILDLGAKVSLLNGDLYLREFSSCKLYPADLTLHSYNGGIISCVGYVKINVLITGITVPHFRFYVVKKAI